MRILRCGCRRRRRDSTVARLTACAENRTLAQLQVARQMTTQLPSTLLQLWKLTGGDPDDERCDWNSVFDPVGLILRAPPRNESYWCTPTNTLTFAVTGGDGVHYGLLSVNEEFTDFSPIVMTVPMCDTPNIILGANLKEFLALGCRYGYFALEQLVYQREETIRKLESARYDVEAEERELVLLKKIASAFALNPWTNPAQRLIELERTFAPSLLLPSQSNQ